MTAQTAIFVPGHGVPETIRSIRFTPKLDPLSQVNPVRTSLPQTPTRVEVWQGDYYGEPTKERLTEFSAFDRTESDYANGEMPVVSPGKSAVVIIHDAPSGYEIEFQSEFTDQQGNCVRRTVTLDNFGTARETLCELKSFARHSAVALHPHGDLRRTAHVARSLRRFVGRLATSISSAFRPAPRATQLSEQHTLHGAGPDRSVVNASGFAPKSLDDSGA